MTNPACPDKATLKLLLLGKLGPEESESLGDHLLQCEACSNLAETIPASDSLTDVSGKIAEIEKQLDAAAAEPTGPHKVIAPTIEIRKPAKVDRSLRDRNASSHGVTRLLSRKPIFLRVVVALAAIAAFIACGVIIITITNKDGTKTRIEVPDDATVEITQDKSRMSTPARPSSGDDPAKSATKPATGTDTRTGKSTHPTTDPDRAAAEWVLSRRANSPPHIEIRTASGEKRLGPNDQLPADRFELLNVQLAGSDDIDDESFGRFIAPLNNLRFLGLEACPKVSDQSVSELKLLAKLDFLDIGGTAITPKKTSELISVMAFSQLGLDTSQFSDVVAETISKTPRLGAVAVRGMTDSQFRLLLQVPHLKIFNCVSADAIRVSSWARLPEALPNLLAIYASGSDLNDAGLSAVSRLARLQNLEVAFCRRITDGGLSLLTTCADLKILWLQGTAVTPLGVSDFLESKPECQVVWDGADHRAVAEWVLSANPLTDDDIVFVEKLTELEELEIAFTQIVNHGWASLAKHPKLKVLRAYNMPVTDEALRHAGPIESLEMLAVASPEVSDAGLQHLRSLRHLRDLNLNHCRRLTDAGLEALAGLLALETLHLNGTPITDAGLKHLAKIKTLKSLNLTECQLSPAAIDDLQDALPWCRIIRPWRPHQKPPTMKS